MLIRPVIRTKKIPLSDILSKEIIPPRRDPGIEQRRAARLAREAEAATRVENYTRAKHTPELDSNNPHRQRKRSQRDHVQSPSVRHGTQRSRLEASKSGPAEAIMAFSRHQVGTTGNSESKHKPPPQINHSSLDSQFFTGPEPPIDIEAIFKSTRGPSSVPQNSKPTLSKVSMNLIKPAPPMDYSVYESTAQDYLQGSQGTKSAYAKIILERNPTMSLHQQQHALNIIQQIAREGKI